MRFNYENMIVENFSLSKRIDPESNVNTSELNYSVQLLNTNNFNVKFSIRISNYDFELDLTACCIFTTEDSLDQEFIQGNFAQINAPAIAYPYIRAYISNVTLLSGFKPVILPTINFVKLNKDQNSRH